MTTHPRYASVAEEGYCDTHNDKQKLDTQTQLIHEKTCNDNSVHRHVQSRKIQNMPADESWRGQTKVAVAKARAGGAQKETTEVQVKEIGPATCTSRMVFHFVEFPTRTRITALASEQKKRQKQAGT